MRYSPFFFDPDVLNVDFQDIVHEKRGRESQSPKSGASFKITRGQRFFVILHKMAGSDGMVGFGFISDTMDL